MNYQLELQKPVINLNGNSASSLMDQMRGVLTALSNLEEAMAQASDVWHGRNFQTLPDSHVRQRMAMDAWQERRAAIGEIHNQMLVVTLDIQHQKHERERSTHQMNEAMDKRIEQTIADSRLGSVDHMPENDTPEGWDAVEGGTTDK